MEMQQNPMHNTTSKASPAPPSRPQANTTLAGPGLGYQQWELPDTERDYLEPSAEHTKEYDARAALVLAARTYDEVVDEGVDQQPYEVPIERRTDHDYTEPTRRPVLDGEEYVTGGELPQAAGRNHGHSGPSQDPHLDEHNYIAGGAQVPSSYVAVAEGAGQYNPATSATVSQYSQAVEAGGGMYVQVDGVQGAGEGVTGSAAQYLSIEGDSGTAHYSELPHLNSEPAHDAQAGPAHHPPEHNGAAAAQGQCRHTNAAGKQCMRQPVRGAAIKHCELHLCPVTGCNQAKTRVDAKCAQCSSTFRPRGMSVCEGFGADEDC